MHAEELTEVIADLEATVKYINDRVTQQADTFDFDQAVALRDSCLAVAESAKEAVSLIETTMLGHLEAGVRQIGSRLFKRKRVVTERFRHDLIRAAVSTWARKQACDDNGEVSPTKAVDAAVQAMDKLYVSASTKAKIGQLDALGIDRKAVHQFDDKGWKLEMEVLDDRKD